MNASGEPITQCPVCRYDLTGLPKNHTCPECGFEYNESMRLWKAWKPSLIWVFVLFLPVLGFIMSITIKLIQIRAMAPIPTPAYVYASLPVLFLLLNIVLLTFTIRRNKSWMIASNHGLHLFRDKRILFFPWKDVLVPSPSDCIIRTPLTDKELQTRPPRHPFWRFFRQDVGGLNLYVTVFTKGHPPRALRLPFVSPRKRRRKAAYEVIYQLWSKEGLTRSET